MDTQLMWIIGAAVIMAMVVVALVVARRRRSAQLRQRFGPEYERTLRETGDVRRTDAALQARAARVERLHIRTLSPEDAQRFTERWRVVQAQFVDDPKAAVTEADGLVGEVMHTRGYPVGTFEQRVEDISVDHPDVVMNYRAARSIAEAHARGRGDDRGSATGDGALSCALRGSARSGAGATGADPRRAGQGAHVCRRKGAQMTAKPATAPLSTADLARTPDAVRAQEARLEQERGVQDSANQPIEHTDAGPGTAQTPVALKVDQPTPLFPDSEAADFRRRWIDVQTSFVDEPRRAVQQADELVAGVMTLLAETFAREREGLEHQWDRGENVTTEDLRIAMQRYRSFFERLLSF